MTEDALSKLTRRFEELNAPDPAGWASSESREDIAQQARFLFLRGIWPLIDEYAREDRLRSIPAGERLVNSGAELSDLTTLMRRVAYEVAFDVLYRVDGDDQWNLPTPDDAPHWRLMEIDRDDNLTGRHLGALYEDLLTLDPSGQEGSDLWL